jgi:hypothetical protein
MMNIYILRSEDISFHWRGLDGRGPAASQNSQCLKKITAQKYNVDLGETKPGVRNLPLACHELKRLMRELCS